MMLTYCTHRTAVMAFMASGDTRLPGYVCVVCVRVYVKLILSIVSVLYNSGRVAKEVMEQSAKIKREPPEIHR